MCERQEADMKQMTTAMLVSDAQRLTGELRTHQMLMGECGEERRRIWAELNSRGITQKRISQACGVVEHTVYTELRKHREAVA